MTRLHSIHEREDKTGKREKLYALPPLSDKDAG
jgi:hypothetical protein